MKELTSEVQVSSDHYQFDCYSNKQRWTSYWHQLDEVLALKPSSVLEIGVGAGIFRMMLKCLGVAVETVDIDPNLKPDYVASVMDLPFSCDAYDVVACFQVLEHLPYDRFVLALREIARVSHRNVLISLPDAGAYHRCLFDLPKIGTLRWGFSYPRPRSRTHVYDGEHHWELNKRGYPLQRVIRDMEIAGLHVHHTYRVWENPYHRMFILEPYLPGMR